MKKRIIALPLIAGVGAAAIAGTSQYAGTQTEGEYHRLLAQLNDLTPLVFINEEYASGVTTSAAVTKVLLSRTADAEVLFRLQHDIEHGTMRMGTEGVDVGAVTIHTRLHEQDVVQSSELLAKFVDDSPFSLKTDVKYTGEINNHLEVSALAISEEGVALNWSGLTFDASTIDGATLGKGSLGTLDFSDESSAGMASVQDSQFTMDVQFHGDQIYTGTSGFTFNDISIVSPAMPVPVSLASIEITGASDLQDDAVNGSSSVSLNGIKSPLPLNNASLEMQIDRFMIEGIRQYHKLVSSFGVDVESLSAQPDIGSALISAVGEMFVPGSAVKYAIAMDNSEGEVMADIRLAMKDGSAEGMSGEPQKNIVTGRDLINLLTLDGSLNADIAALAQTPLVAMLGGAGDFVTVTEESITSEVSLWGTTLVVNGVELPLDTLSGGMLDIPLNDLMTL